MHAEHVTELMALAPGETIAIILPEGYSDKRFAEELHAEVERCETSTDRYWFVYPNGQCVLAAWLPESEGPWMPKGGKWTEIIDKAAALAVGENFEIDRFADMSAPTFRTILYAMLRASRATRDWMYSVHDATEGMTDARYRVTKRLKEQGAVLALRSPVHGLSTLQRIGSAVIPQPQNNGGTYSAVIADLEKRAEVLRTELAGIETAIQVLRSLK